MTTAPALGDVLAYGGPHVTLHHHCAAESPGYSFLCTARVGHPMPHVAGTPTPEGLWYAVALWDETREVTLVHGPSGVRL